MHLWSRSVLRKIGYSCGGFLAMDKDTTFMYEFRLARIWVKWDGNTFPQFVEVSVDLKRYEIKLW